MTLNQEETELLEKLRLNKRLLTKREVRVLLFLFKAETINEAQVLQAMESLVNGAIYDTRYYHRIPNPPVGNCATFT